MKRILAFIGLALLSGQSSLGQQLHPIFNSEKPGNSILLNANAGMASNSIHPKFIWDMYTGQALNRDLREGQLNLMGANNRIGGDLDYGLFFKSIADSASFGWFLDVSNHTNANLSFSKDLYHLAFLGNAAYAGKNASLNFKLQLWDYKKFGAGVIIKKDLKAAKLQIGIGANFLMINKHAQAEFSNSELFTHEFGEFLDVTANGEVFTSGLNSAGYFNYAGYGFSGDILGQVKWPKHTLTFQALDLGGAVLERDHNHYTIDSSYRYEGIHIDLFASDDEPFSNLQLDSLQERLGLRSFGNQTYSAMLPSIFHIRSEHEMGSGKWTLFGGVQYRLAAYFPLLYVGSNFKLPAKFRIQPAFAWGGYGSWNIGLEISKEFAEIASVSFGTNNLEGLILPEIGTGQSAYAKLEFHF